MAEDAAVYAWEDRVGQAFLPVRRCQRSGYLRFATLDAQVWKKHNKTATMRCMFYRRHLPHWQKAGAALFITWRLYGSLPRKILAASLKETNFGKRFLLLDRELDRAQYGPMWLKDVRLSKIVSDSLWWGAEHKGLYRLSAYVVMSNHVHILIWPKAQLDRITKSIKGYTARECNKLLERTGKKFWQDESFDHAVRSQEEFCRISRYIENNPVKAGLVATPGEWLSSSAAQKKTTLLQNLVAT